jgi:hypothetical protein
MQLLYSNFLVIESHSFLKPINSVIIVITKGFIKEMYFSRKAVSCRHFYPRFGSVHSEHHTNDLLILLYKAFYI